MIVLRLLRSATTPPKRISPISGTSEAKASRPRRNGECDKLSTSHGCATCCIQLPVLERKLPNQSRRKLRNRKDAKVVLNWRSIAGVTATSIFTPVGRANQIRPNRDIEGNI